MTSTWDGDGGASRRSRAESTFTRLFGARDVAVPETDPEFMEILRCFVLADVFGTGELDDQTRELITVTVLACLDAPTQLTIHAGAALNVGVAAVAVREAVYQLAPFIGFPRTLNAIEAINAAFTARGIELPLPAQGTVAESDRYTRGRAVQAPLYGDEIKNNLASLPAPYGEALPRMLTEFCFGDFYTRNGLDLAQRELLILCALTALGDTAPQLTPHARACLQTGNSLDTVLAALVHCFPYVGFPRTIAAVRAVKDLPSPDEPSHSSV